MAKQYYRVRDLHTIREKKPDTLKHIQNLAERADHLRTVMSAADKSSNSLDRIIIIAGLMDLFLELRPAYAELQTVCRQYTNHPFFFQIEDYNSSGTKYIILLALYDDIRAMEK